jgi:hypothetical protein
MKVAQGLGHMDKDQVCKCDFYKKLREDFNREKWTKYYIKKKKKKNVLEL